VALRRHRLVRLRARNQLDVASVFAGLLVVIAIGLPVEGSISRLIERATLHRWGIGA
jgi:NitT/TauT family transport system permease protein